MIAMEQQALLQSWMAKNPGLDPGAMRDKIQSMASEGRMNALLASATNGTPIITQDGIVLGGNSRVMTLQTVYGQHPQNAAAYRQMLADQASQFGIDPAAVANMRRPILVRVVDGDISLEDMAVKSRLYNQTTTQKLQQKAEGVSRARLISADTLNMLAERMAEFDTLRQFMDSPKSKDFVQSLQNDGVIEKTEYSSLTDSAGKLNDSGKKLVEDALRGFVVPNYDVLEATPPSILAKIDKAIPALAKLKARGEGWDLTNVLLPALRYLSQAALEEKKIDVWLGQADLLDMDADKKRPAVQALALTLGNATQKEVAARFDAFAAEATRQPKGVSMLMAMPENNPAPAFIRAFLRPIVSVDGNNIADFNPASNNTRKALQWAYEHGGKSHSVDVAMNALQKNMVSEKTSEQERIEAREMMGALSEYSGEIRIQEPKLGNFFHYKKGQELFQDGHDYPNNGKPVGEVTPEFAQVMKLHKTGKIVLDDKSIAHIEERHGKQIRGLGFEDAESFVRYVLDNVDVIYAVDDGRKYDLVSRQITPQGRVMIRLEFVDPEEYYSISTAGPVRKDNYKKKTPLWERAQSNHSNEGTPGAISGQSGIEINLSHINPNDNTLNSIDSTGSKRGSVQIYPESYLINLFEKADLSTLLHETGHVFFEEMERLVRAGAADASVIADYQTMRDWLGAKDGEQLTTEQREQAARGFEAYLMEGKAPTPELQSAFRRFKKRISVIWERAARIFIHPHCA